MQAASVQIGRPISASKMRQCSFDIYFDRERYVVDGYCSLRVCFLAPNGKQSQIGNLVVFRCAILFGQRGMNELEV